MNLSLNEMEALCRRAAVGAGLHWGLAEEAGKAARWLAEFDLPGAQALLRYLETLSGGSVLRAGPVSLEAPWRAEAGRLCPLIAGPALCDSAERLAKSGGLEMENVCFPVLVLPHAAATAEILGECVSLDWQALHAVTDGRCLSLASKQTDLLSEQAVSLTCRLGGRLWRHRARHRRACVSADCFDRLSALAHRSFAPATAQSRMLGAGSGCDEGNQ
ncbi:DUF3726 domain-containing protein [Phycobacter azelaicus]|uniref:DUF3726 domain-containing protein n=1 Tax=Phycobacter azelaicus TaxID=2668075 RepID=UPI0018661CBA